MLRVILTTGGTGGHVFPALAVAGELKKQVPDVQILFMGGRYGLEQHWVHDAGIELPVISAANSAATDSYPAAHFNAVRPGIILYGLPPDPAMSLHLKLKPVMSLVTRIVFIKHVPAGTPVNYGCTYLTPKPTWLATLPVGYADGYSRHLSNKAEVLVHGIRRRVVGRICMDQTVIDLGPDCDATVGDEVILCGRQGREKITLTELANIAGTINYELACGISPRVPRIYKNAN